MAERHEPDGERREVEREVIVTDRDRGGPGTAIAVLLAVLAVLLIGWLFFFGGPFAGDDGDVNVDVPEQVDVEVEQPQNGGGDGGGNAGR